MNNIFSKIFMWMFIGLLITFGVGMYVSTNSNMIYNIYSTGLYWVIIIAEFVLAIVLGLKVDKMNKLTAEICFILYSTVTGLMFSSIFLVYELTSIIIVFGVTSIIFLIFSILGYITKIDLSKLSTFLFMGLIAVIIMQIVNIFVGNSTFDSIISIISIIVFIGYVAFDIQKIKEKSYMNADSLAIRGALELYIDFINIFIDLIKLIGKSRD